MDQIKISVYALLVTRVNLLQHPFPVISAVWQLRLAGYWAPKRSAGSFHFPCRDPASHEADEASAANLQWALGWSPAGAAQEQPEGSISP